MKREARISCNPVTFQRFLKSEDPKKLPKVKAFAVSSVASQTNSVPDQEEKFVKKRNCVFCKEAHELETCERFLQIPLEKRREFIIANRLCRGCLRWGHVNSKCRKKKSCKTCEGLHPTALHGDKPEAKGKEGLYSSPSQSDADRIRETKTNNETISNRVEVLRTSAGGRPVCYSLIVPVWLHHHAKPEHKIMVYALLDEQLDACFIKDSILETLNVSGPNVQLELSTVLAKEVIESQKITGLICRGVNKTVEIPMPRTYTRCQIPASPEQIASLESARAWPHLEKIAEKLMPYRSDVEVGLLIGTSYIRAIKPREIIMGGNEDPYAKRTDLGWGIIGAVQTSENEAYEEHHVAVNRVLSHEVHVGEDKRISHLAFKAQTKEILSPSQVNKMFELDFGGGEKEPPFSHEDRLFIKKIEQGIHQRSDGHYELPLPFKDNNIQLPDNKEQALARLGRLRQRLKNDGKYHLDYIILVPEQELNLEDGRVCLVLIAPWRL